jgi:hypothetical protein
MRMQEGWYEVRTQNGDVVTHAGHKSSVLLRFTLLSAQQGGSAEPEDTEMDPIIKQFQNRRQQH